MILLSWIVGIVLILGLLSAGIGLLSATDGFEDETGFHTCRSSDPRLT